MMICRSAAKINLTLDLLAHRPDGYHELQSIVHTVGLWDTLTFEFDFGPGFSLRCNEPNLSGDDNLCLKAARAWLSATRERGLRLRFNGLRITLQKTIPAGAGLGGGSGNAAATLRALNADFAGVSGPAPLDDTTLHAVAAKLGADVPFFLHGGCALMEGIGERLTPLPALTGWVVLVKPPLDLSTAAVYRQWDELGLASTKSTPVVQSELVGGDLSKVASALQNDLSSAARELGSNHEFLVNALLESGALGAQMSGSGSGVFGLFAGEEAARHAAVQMEERLSARDDRLDHQVFTVSLCASAIEFLDSPLSGLPITAAR